MTRPALSRALVALLLAGALVVAGCGGSSKVAPKAYIDHVCTDLSSWVRSLRGSAANLQSSFGSAGNIQQRKQALNTFLDHAVSQTDQALSSIKSAGVPDTKNGQKVQNALVQAFQQADQSFRRAQSEARSLPTNDPKKFNQAGEQVTKSLNQASAGITQSLRGVQAPELDKLAAANPNCRALAGA